MLAPQGAGKGTQAARLAAHYGIEHISSGDLLRSEVARGSDIGKAVHAYLNQGDLVPDDLILQMMVRRLLAAAQKGFVLDGWPRTINQALAADDLVGDMPAVGLQAVVNLVVPTEELHRRLRARAEREDRTDDTDAVIQHRLDIYERETKPLLAYYRAQGILVSVDGDQPPEVVTKDIVTALDALVPPARRR
ncbi:MAG: adenylate kinase [Acidimicrobiaceae bacterium]|nr:adenylate kinase [Acidimicrobiaceae bacterium]